MSKFTQLNEEQEKSLVEKVDTRLVLSNTDLKFEQSLSTFLPPLLLKLASPYASVRDLVYGSIKHVTSRINSNSNLQLPVKKLLDQIRKPSLNSNQDPANVLIYSLLFLSKGLERLNEEKKREYIPQLIKDIHKMPELVSSRLFSMLCKLLLSWKPPLRGTEEENEFHTFLNIQEQDFAFLLEKFTKFFLLSPKHIDSDNVSYSCPGLSAKDVSFFIYNSAVDFKKDLLNNWRRAVFSFVVSGFSKDDQSLIPFLIIVSRNSMDISDEADTLLKRIEIPYENEDFIKNLTLLFCGDKAQQIPPVSSTVQEKLISFLSRSVLVSKLDNYAYEISLVGIRSDNIKLKIATLAFIRHVCKHNYLALLTKDDNDNNQAIINVIQNYVKLDGWPKFINNTMNKSTALQLRRSQYETIGEILRQDFESVKDLKFIEFFMDSLRGDISEFRSSIQEALSGLVSHLSKLPDSSSKALKKIMKSFLEDEYIVLHGTNDEKESLMSCRFISMKFANAAFDFGDPDARYFNILGTARTNRFDVIQEAYKGLNPHLFRVNRASLKTGFVSTSELLGGKVVEMAFVDFSDFAKRFLNELKNIDELSTISHCIVTAVRFLKQILISNAVFHKRTVIVQDENWSLRIEKSLEIDDTVGMLVSEKTKELSFMVLQPLMAFLLKEAIQDHNLSDRNDEIFSSFFLLLVRHCSTSILIKLESTLQTISDFFSSNKLIKLEYMEHIANAFGIIGSNLGTKSNIVSLLISKIQTNESNINEFYLGGYLLPRLVLLNQSDYTIVIQNIFESALTFIKSSQHKILTQQVLSQMLRFRTLTLLSDEKRIDIIKDLINELQPKLMNDENMIITWGYIAMNAPGLKVFDSLLNAFDEIYVSKHVDYHFAAGESLSTLLGGYNSKFVRRQMDISCQPESLMDGRDTEHLEQGLNKVLVDCSSTKPQLQKASCIWLLSVVQYLGHLQAVKAQFQSIHLTFMKFLANRDEFVQETASRGLSIVYEMSDNELKTSMVKGLFRSLTDSTKALSLQSGSVSDETELFEPGLLHVGDGSVSTYKDILNLANEVNDPGLVYKFMALAKNSSLWSSRKGVAFGLGAIMARSSLENQLINDHKMSKKLIPKLYRYKFDPSDTVSRSMDNIWEMLVPDTSIVVDKFFDEILAELLINSGNKEWRVREASCMALLSLVQTYPVEKYEIKSNDVWTVAFRCMDDIKDSVRSAGAKLARTLSNRFIRSIDVESGASNMQSEKLLDIILPFLLGTKGLNSDAEDVRSFAIKMLLELIQKTGTSLKSYVPTLVYELTLMLSALEPQVINYLSLNADKYQLKTSSIDKQRFQGVSNSPLMQAIEKLIDISRSDETSLAELVDSCIKAVKRSIGLPSNIGASRVIQLLCLRHALYLKPFSGKLLKSCFNAIHDKNDVVSSSYAVSVGYLFRISKLEKQVKYAEKLVNEYFEFGNIEEQKIVAVAIEAIYKHAPEQFQDIASTFMPLIFIAKHTPDKAVADLFETLWIESSSYGAGTLRLYFPEIIELISKHIKSNIFSVRQTCATSMWNACEQFDGSNDEKSVQKIFEVLLESCQGKSWDGKELVVIGVIKSFKKFNQYIKNDGSLIEKIRSTVLVEVSRKNKSYVKKVIGPFAEFVFYQNDPKMFNKLKEVVSAVFNDLNTVETGNDEIPSEDSVSKKKPRLTNNLNQISTEANTSKEDFKVQLLKTIAECSSDLRYANDGIDYAGYLDFVLHLSEERFETTSILFTWRSQLSFYEVGIEILNRNDNETITGDIADKFIHYWKCGFKVSHGKNSIESVKVRMIRFGGIMMKKLPSARRMIEYDLNEMISNDPSTILKAEATNIGLVLIISQM